MKADIPRTKKWRGSGWWIAGVLVGVGALYIASNLFVLFVYYPARTSAAKRRFWNADHRAILVACRQMHEQREQYRKEWPVVEYTKFYPPDTVIWDKETGPLGPRVPKAIRELDPIVIFLKRDYVMVRLNAPASRQYFIAFPEGSFEWGTKKMISGLWYWNGRLDESVREEFERRYGVHKRSKENTGQPSRDAPAPPDAKRTFVHP